MSGLAAGDVPKLKLKWASAFPVSSAPTASRRSLEAACSSARKAARCTRSARRRMRALDFNADAAVRAAITIARAASGNAMSHSSAIAPRTSTRSTPHRRLIWKSHVDDHPFARVTASPTYHDGRLYVGVASGEETAGRRRGIRVLHLPRQPRRSRCLERRARLEDLHDRGAAEAREEPDRHAAVGPSERRSGRAPPSTSQKNASTSRPATTTAARPPTAATRSWRSTWPRESCSGHAR
jgi:hypothetical protein